MLCLSSKAQRKANRRGIKAGKPVFHLHTLGFTWLEIFPPEKLDWRSAAPQRAPELEQDRAISLGPAAEHTGRRAGTATAPSAVALSFALPQHGWGWTAGARTRGWLRPGHQPTPTTKKHCTCTQCCNTDFLAAYTKKHDSAKNMRPVSERLSTNLVKHCNSPGITSTYPTYHTQNFTHNIEHHSIFIKTDKRTGISVTLSLNTVLFSFHYPFKLRYKAFYGNEMSFPLCPIQWPTNCSEHLRASL